MFYETKQLPSFSIQKKSNSRTNMQVSISKHPDQSLLRVGASHYLRQYSQKLNRDKEKKTPKKL